MERLTSILAESREHYLGHYRAVVRRAAAERPQAAAELLIELTAPTSQLFRRLTRVDVIWGGAERPSIIEANVDPVSVAECLHEEPGPPVLRVFPVVWNACELRFADKVGFDDAFGRWFNRWLDPEDRREQDEDGLAGVIHSVTIPAKRGDTWSFSVDFGSAPVDAALELLALPSLGTSRKLDVGSFSYRP